MQVLTTILACGATLAALWLWMEVAHLRAFTRALMDRQDTQDGIIIGQSEVVRELAGTTKYSFDLLFENLGVPMDAVIPPQGTNQRGEI